MENVHRWSGFSRRLFPHILRDEMKVVPVLVFTLAIAFGQGKDAALLSHYDLSAKHPTTFVLPKRVSEASGLTMTADGRLFCHDDERGVVYQIDYTNGKIIKQFSLGRFGVKGDFEDIAMKGTTFYLAESNGTIYEFPDAGDGQSVEFQVYRTSLTARNDVEGLVYDPETDCLLLACKGFPGKGFGGYKAVYSFSLSTKRLSPQPRFLISLKKVTKHSTEEEFKPSGITRNPGTGTFFIIAAHGWSIIELSTDGKILAQQSINPKANPHPEGIAFAPDQTLILCNDGQGERGTLTIYPYRP